MKKKRFDHKAATIVTGSLLSISVIFVSFIYLSHCIAPGAGPGVMVFLSALAGIYISAGLD